MYAKNVKYLSLGKELALHAGGVKVTQASDLLDGEIAVVDMYGNTYKHGSGSVITSTLPIRLAVNYNGYLMYSPVFKGADVTKCVARKYHTQEEQIDFIGYNCAGGSIDLITVNDYIINCTLIEGTKTGGGLNSFVSALYKSLITDTEQNVAYSLCKNLYANIFQWVEPIFTIDRVCSGAVTVEDFGLVDYGYVNVTKNSKWITFQVAPATAFSVGDIIGLAGLCFIIKTVNSSTEYELDMPWQHPSGVVIMDDATAPPTITTVITGPLYQYTLSVATTLVAGTRVYVGIADSGSSLPKAHFYSGIMAAANSTLINMDMPYKGTAGAGCMLSGGLVAAGGSWGIRLQGIKRIFISPRVSIFNKVRWITGIENFGLTTITSYNTAKEQSGNYEQVAEEEWFCQGFEGISDKKDYLTQVRNEVLSMGKYDVMSIDFYQSTGPDSIGVTTNQPIQIMAVVDNETGSANSMTDTNNLSDTLADGVIVNIIL